MKDFRYIGYPLFIILISALLYQLTATYMTGNFQNTLLILIRVVALFSFGMALNKTSRRHLSVWKIVLSVVVTIFLLLYELGAFSLPYLSSALAFFGIGGFFFSMLYILCGYLFAD